MLKSIGYVLQVKLQIMLQVGMQNVLQVALQYLLQVRLPDLNKASPFETSIWL